MTCRAGRRPGAVATARDPGRLRASRLRLSMLGPPVVEGPRTLVPLRAATGSALLWYLAAQPDRSVTRSGVAGLWWEHVQEAAGRHVLSTLWPALPVRAARATLAWDPDAGVEVDLHLL